MNITKQGWEPWPRDVGLGYSLKDEKKSLLADMQPARPEGGLTCWEATVWAEGSSKAEPLFTVVEEDHWRCAAETKLRMNEWKG